MSAARYLRAILAATVMPLVVGITPQVSSAQGRTPQPGLPPQAAADDHGRPGADARRVIPNEFIVVLRDNGADPEQVANEHGVRHGLTKRHVFDTAIRGYSATIPPARLAAVRADPQVLFVSEDREVQAFETVALRTGDNVPTGVQRIEAGTTTTVHQASAVNVAVIDTGIASHPDLTVAGGAYCRWWGSITNGGPDNNGHGTHVAGTIAARNNGSGAVGVAPGTRLYAVKVLEGDGSGSFSQIICGINWVTKYAAAYNIKVASMSLGGPAPVDTATCSTTTDAMRKAICNSTATNITYVVAAGNIGVDLAGVAPAAYPEVLTVTAMSDSDGQGGGTGAGPSCWQDQGDDRYATFSNYASPTDARATSHTIAAPGVCIRSTWLNGGYNTISGTSMATPHVSGLVALCFGNGNTAPCAGMTPARIIEKLRADAQALATTANGFRGDPSNGATEAPGKYFGYLARPNMY